MSHIIDESRREFLKRIAFDAVLLLTAAGSARVAAAEAPLVTADDATAKALKYVNEASKAPDAKPGSKCANCSLYQGAKDSAQAGCLLFPGKSVKAAGWCSSWTAKT